MRKLWKIGLMGLLALTVLACPESATPTEPPTFSPGLEILSGDRQTAPVNSRLPANVVVRFADRYGHPVARQIVYFVVTAGEGSPWVANVMTDLNGQAQNVWTLGPVVGEQTLEVRTVDQTNGMPYFVVVTARGE